MERFVMHLLVLETAGCSSSIHQATQPPGEKPGLCSEVVNKNHVPSPKPHVVRLLVIYESRFC